MYALITFDEIKNILNKAMKKMRSKMRNIKIMAGTYEKIGEEIEKERE